MSQCWIFTSHNPSESYPRFKSNLRDEDSRGPDLGLPNDGSGLDLHRLHHGHGGLEDHLNRRNGGLLHHQGGMVLVQPVEILFHRLYRCQQLLRLPRALVCGGSVTNRLSGKTHKTRVIKRRYDFPLHLCCASPSGNIQIVRGLLMSALSVGMLGFVLSLLGMECTYLGGKDHSKYKKIFAGGCCHVLGGNVPVSIPGRLEDNSNMFK